MMETPFVHPEIRAVHDWERPIFRMSIKGDILEVEYIDYHTYIKRKYELCTD